MAKEIALKNKPQQDNWVTNTLHGIRKTRYLQLLVLPGLIFFIIFHYVPMYGAIIAFKNFRGGMTLGGAPWAENFGFEHFIRFFKYPDVWKIIRNTLLLNLYGIVFSFWVPIMIALFINELNSVFYKKSIQTIIFLPHFIALPAMVGILFLILSPTDGMVNQILAVFGIKPIYFMLKSEWFRPIYIGSGIWQGAGWGCIIYLAALSRVDPELYESAIMDGANRIRQMWHISLPSIMPTIIILLILRMGRMMASGTGKILLMYSPLTYETADVIGTYLFRRGIIYAEYSYAAAVGLVNSSLNALFLIGANWLSKRTTKESLW